MKTVFAIVTKSCFCKLFCNVFCGSFGRDGNDYGVITCFFVWSFCMYVIFCCNGMQRSSSRQADVKWRDIIKTPVDSYLEVACKNPQELSPN